VLTASHRLDENNKEDEMKHLTLQGTGGMKKLVIGALTVLSVLLLATPAAAKTAEPVGAQINILLGTPTTYPAGAPFHIIHATISGFVLPPRGTGKDGFALEVDGVPRAPDFILRDAIPPSETGLPYPGVRTGFLFNFPDGMTGTHTFTGHWYAPCATAVALDGYTDPCRTPSEQVEYLTRSLAVIFTP
jgi:hypothetical protein